jgi:hypothetical protein
MTGSKSFVKTTKLVCGTSPSLLANVSTPILIGITERVCP